MTHRTTTFALRLAASLKAAVEKMAAAQKRLRGQGYAEAAIRFLTRPGGEPPRSGDEPPN